jgi:tetratricopeptide (TPR) repeat protein
MSLSEQATVYMAAAVRMYGDAVLSADYCQAADAGIALGLRLMQQVFGARDRGGQLPRAMQDLIVYPGDGRAAPAELEECVHDALFDDPGLEAAVSQELITFYQREIAAGSTQAMVELGDLLRAEGDSAGARAAYQRAIEAGNAHALIDLARLLRGDMGDAEGARVAFQQAVDSGDPDLAAEALVDLGYLFMVVARDYAATRACFEEAIGSGHADWAPAAMVGLARLLEKQGDTIGARAACQRAAEAGNADCAANALVFLGVMLAQERRSQRGASRFPAGRRLRQRRLGARRPGRTAEPVTTSGRGGGPVDHQITVSLINVPFAADVSGRHRCQHVRHPDREALLAALPAAASCGMPGSCGIPMVAGWTLASGPGVSRCG